MIQGAGAMAYCGGQTYFADTFNYAIRKIDASGHITTVAGTGYFGYGGDGGPATSALFGRVFGLACRTGGGLYVSDSDNGAVRIIDAGGIIRNWYSGFSFPTGITELGGANIVAVSDSGLDNAVWKLTSQTPSLVAGTPGIPGYSGDNGPAGGGNSQLYDPRGLAFVGGSLYISDRGNNVLRVVDGMGFIRTAMMLPVNRPAGLVADTANNLLYVASSGSFTVITGNVINSSSAIVAGNGTPSLSGDGGQAAQAQLGNPYAVAVDSMSDLFIADNQNAVIRKVGPTGIITTVAGNGVAGYSGDGGSATAAELNDPRGVAVAPNGDIYISDTGNQRVRRVDHSTGLISTVVASLHSPRSVAVDATGNLYIADTGANLVYVVNSSGAVIPVAGTGTAGYSGDGGPATAASLNQPRGVAVDSALNVYIVDSNNNRVRRVDHGTGMITTVAGNGTAGFGGDGHVATSAELNFPFDAAVDNVGNLYISDSLNNRIRVVDSHGNITSVVGICGGIPGFSGDGAAASIAQVNIPFGVAVDAFNDLFIADVNSNRVRAAAGLAGVRGSSCQGPAGSPGSRSAKPSGSSTQPPTRMADGVGTSRTFSDVSMRNGRAPNLPVQPTRISAQPSAKTPGAGQTAPALAPPAPAPGSHPARGFAPAGVLVGRPQPPSPPWGSVVSLLLLIPVALTTLVATVIRGRRKRSRS
jgi:sugar lactone lactonase YvrE